ncbi:unnamed protein product [Adineta steineri]|uniref:Ubiquitin-like domain-containing protein n=1 Tax=Adineta steineri TaxID=433720 RepID=A0A814I0V5_9BILA|nr:unnamed protein product [Adineta steineri]CAF4034506.1 unnamed protein product [Adineta steineri]
MYHHLRFFFVIIIVDLSIHTTTVFNSTELNNFIQSESITDERIELKISFINSLSSSSQICLSSGNNIHTIYSNSTFTLLVKCNFGKEKSFEIETNLNTYIYELKQIIQQKTGHPHDQQRLEFTSRSYFELHRNLQDTHKLGDYITIENNTCKYILRVYKRKENKHLIFNSIPNVTHYEYVMMSSHVYQPNESFLDGWHVKQFNLPNKNGLSLVAYINPERHQCVISIRGTDLTSSLFNNPITDLRLLFTNQAIDTFDSARLLLFYDKLLHIPRQNGIPYVVSFTGHSLGAALAESFACVYNGYAVTFDSPGTKHILHNDPSCRTNIELGYNLTEHIHNYLGAYANVVNVANPQSGRVIYLKQFGTGNDTRPAEFFYIYSSAAGVYMAACIFANIIDKNMFKLGLWFTIGYCIQKSSIVYSLSNLFNLNIVNTLNYFINELPFIITVCLLFQSVSTLADAIEHRIDQIWKYLSLKNIPLIGRIIIFIEQNINFTRVIWRFILLYIYLILSFFISIGIPIICYMWWLLSAHSINKFVDSFNPENGIPYQGEMIEPILWPSLFDYITKTASKQFLLFLLLIQSMKLVAFYLFPQSFPRWFRINLILLLFAMFFNIDSIEYLIFMFILFLFMLFPATQQDNPHYTRNIVCAISGLLAIMQFIHERHHINKFYYEVVSFCSLLLIPFVKKFLCYFSFYRKKLN